MYFNKCGMATATPNSFKISRQLLIQPVGSRAKKRLHSHVAQASMTGTGLDALRLVHFFVEVEISTPRSLRLFM